VSFNHNRRNNDEFGRQGVGVRPREPNSQFPPQTGGFDSNFQGVTDESNTSGKIGLRWTSDTLGMFYGTYAQGYKGPAFNTFYNMGATDVLPIGAEESDAYELGWKYTGEYLFLNLAVFRTEIENYQANNFDTSTGVTITRLTNAGDITTEGFEAEFLWQPLDYLSFGGGVASVDATIDEFNCPIEPTTGEPPPNCSTRSGLDVPFSPDLKYSLYGSWVIPVNTVEFFVNGSIVYTDEQQSDLPGYAGTFNPAALLPDYTLFNLNAGVSFADGAMRITLIGRNLGDESFVTTFSGDGFRYQLPRDADRFWGINLRANF
jgi:iron complex outermembrane receptor protein